MTNLSVNLNKVALLRNQRDLPYPSVVAFAEIAIDAGAVGVTAHPRPDERHIRRSDVTDLARLLAEKHAGRIELNIEGNPTGPFLALVEAVRPDQATLVPDAPDARTSDHGWDIPANAAFLGKVIARLKDNGARVSLFVDPDPAVAPLARAVGADRVELYTEPYARAFATPRESEVTALYRATAEAARAEGLGVNAGHDLTLDNLPALIAAIPWIAEVSIGHALTADALRWGFGTAVTKYLAALREGRQARAAAG